MEQRLIRARGGIVLAALPLIWPLASCSSEERQAGTVTTNNVSAELAAESQRLARQIQELKEIPLPDEWQSADGSTLRERFESTSKAMRAKGTNAPTASELMARYENGGKPFMHSVWFFHPLHCPKCNQAGSAGYYIVMSIRLGLSVTISAGEMHEVTKHQGAFPVAKLEVLRKILVSN